MPAPQRCDKWNGGSDPRPDRVGARPGDRGAPTAHHRVRPPARHRRLLQHRRLRKLASSFVLLETHIDPNRLEMDSAVRKNALGELYDFVCEIETLPA